jgi:hypothetical protein
LGGDCLAERRAKGQAVVFEYGALESFGIGRNPDCGRVVGGAGLGEGGGGVMYCLNPCPGSEISARASP